MRLAQKAILLYAKSSGNWNNLGMARYRCEDYQATIEAFSQSFKLQPGPDGYSFFFLAMSHRQLGDKKEARIWYDQGVQWMRKNNPNDAKL